MKSSKIDRIVSIVVIGTCLIKAVLYGGSKPQSTTNEPPSGIEGDQSAATNEPPEIVDDDPAPTNQPLPVLMASRPRLILSAPPQTQTENEPSAIHNSSFILQNSWNTRGAYCDWLRVDFPSSFAFPLGTNLLTGVTLMAYGTLRQTLIDPTPIAALPQPVAIEPGVSSCAYGLTPSNSFLFAWSNVCVNRSPTNRVNAAIELFSSGVCSVRFGASQTDYPPIPPPDFPGIGQDDDWVLGTFPGEADAILSMGYDAWLDDYIGINVQNGRYKAMITIDQQPTTNNQQPIYLVCGPYKVVVDHPGTYSFPLEVFEHYRTRTYPVALPLTISTDDGYRGDLPPALLSYACCSPAPVPNAQLPTPSQLSNSPVLIASRPRLALAAPPPQPPEYDICEEPRLVLSPSQIPLDQAVGTHILIWCNVASAARRYSALISREFRLNFCNPSDAEIVAAEVEDLVEIIIDAPLGTCAGTITITDNDLCCGCGSCTGSDCTCGCDCWRHPSPSDTPTNSPSATP